VIEGLPGRVAGRATALARRLLPWPLTGLADGPAQRLPPWPAVAGPAGKGVGPSPRWRARRWSYFAGPWLVYLGYPLAALWRQGSLAERVLGTALLAAFCVDYIFGIPKALVAGTVRARHGLLLRMLAVAALLTVLVGTDGLATLVYLASGTIVLLPPRQSIPIAVLLSAAAALLPAAVPGWHSGPQWAAGLSVLGSAFIGFGFITLIRSNAALRMAREEVARLAADEERMRIARDMHDLLGHTLTTVTVKAELARRLVYRDPGRAESELADVERLARQSLADVRAVVAGYREVSLAVELATAREVLAAAGIVADLPQAVDAVPGELRELFGWAVREGVTNAVRHSRARRVQISVAEDAVEVIDDGAGHHGEPGTASGRIAGGRPGTGLAGLAERAARLGGRLEAGPLAGQGYRLRVEVPRSPLPEPTQEPASVAP
jgi:two-component system sensor histidine kinase DesK